MKPAIFKSFVSSMVIMWDDNFKQALYDGIDPSDGYSPSDASEALQEYFKEIMAGTKPSPSNSGVFYKIRNGALLLLSSKYKRDVNTILDASFRIGVAKNRDYGTLNILRYGVIGIIVRINDKIERVSNLMKDGNVAQVADEKIEDTLMDMVNYATYGIMLCNGIWV